MTELTDEIQIALKAGLWYVALTATLTLPDICAALESPDGATSASRYKQWYRTWLATKYERMTEDDIYSLRCGVVHQGRFGHPKMQYARIIFVPSHMGRMHNNLFGTPDRRMLQLSVPEFCQDVIESVLEWHRSKESDIHVQANSQRLLQRRPNGLPQYQLGFEVIA